MKETFYNRGHMIFKRPEEVTRHDGTRAFKMGFLVCHVAPEVEPESVVHILNNGFQK